jgi:2-iminobutanoate/2-iminopropanoate deaminase
MTNPTPIASPDAPTAIGPYVQAVAHHGVLYCSGSLPLDPATGQLDNADLTAEVRRSLGNLEAVCREAGTSLDRALRLGVFTTRLEAFAEINAAYTEHFDGRPVPARTTIGVAALPLGAVVEIDAIVALT